MNPDDLGIPVAAGRAGDDRPAPAAAPPTVTARRPAGRLIAAAAVLAVAVAGTWAYLANFRPDRPAWT